MPQTASATKMASQGVPLSNPAPPPSELSQLREEVQRLKRELMSTRETLKGYRQRLDAQNRATFRHSRLIRLLEVLNIPLPKSDDDYIAEDYLTIAKSQLPTRDEVNGAVAERDVALEAIRLLTGARAVSVERGGEGRDVVTFSLVNDSLGREMCFNISWDDRKIEYNRLSLQVEQAVAPPFADEECIVFDFHQGPFFLAEVLSAVHDIPVNQRANDSPA